MEFRGPIRSKILEGVVETELKSLSLKNKNFGIMEFLLYQNLYKTKNSPYLTNLKYTWDFSRKKNG
jgi:hypothetical protein